MINYLLGETRLIVGNERDSIPARNIKRSHNRELVPGNPGIKLNVADASAGDGAADGNAMQHLGKGEIVHVSRLPGNLAATFSAGKRRSNQTLCHSVSETLLASHRRGGMHNTAAGLLFRNGQFERGNWRRGGDSNPR